MSMIAKNIANQHIMLLVPNLEHGGSERQAALLALALRRKGHEIAVATFHQGGPFEAALEKAGIPVFSLGAGKPLGPFLVVPRLVRLLRRQGIDVLYSFLPPANVLASLSGLLVPMCRVVWSVRSADMPLAGYGLKTQLAYGLERLLARLPRRIIVNSRAGYEACKRKGFSEQRLTIVHNGFDTELFRPDNDARQRIRAEFGIPSDQIAIGLPARMDPVKDHPTFLRAAALLRKNRTDVRFVCLGGAGPPGYSDTLRELAKTLGIADCVVWAGNRSDIAAALNALDIATLCSVSEGFPNTVGEAMACGVPCVVTDVGDAAHLVGDSGYVVAKGDPGALADAWKRLLDRATRTRLGESARLRIIENFGLDRLREQTLTALSDAQ
jgi:glycosyltransferase involved in cell wall biosynthesis